MSFVFNQFINVSISQKILVLIVNITFQIKYFSYRIRSFTKKIHTEILKKIHLHILLPNTLLARILERIITFSIFAFKLQITHLVNLYAK